MPAARLAPHAHYTPAGADGIGLLELTRPEKLNATDDRSVRDLDRAVTRAARDAKVWGAATEMMLLGETWGSARAERVGLVHRRVPARRLDAVAHALAEQLAANVRAASVATKRLTRRAPGLPLERFLAEYVREQRACWNDRETQATLARYRDGRWGARTRA